MKKYVSYGNDTNCTDILFNDNLGNDKLRIHEIGYSKRSCEGKQAFVRDSYFIHYILDGEVDFLGKKLSGGSGFFMMPNEYAMFSTKSNQNWCCSWIQISGSDAKNLLENAGFQNRNHTFSHKAVTDIAKYLRDSIYQDYTDYDINFKFISILYNILAMHKAATVSEYESLSLTKSDEYVHQAIRYIKENYKYDISTTDIANSVNLSPNHLCKLFKKVINRTIKDYLANYRVTVAELLLEETNLSINDIANSVGYYDSMYFSQVFKKYNSSTPTDFRKKCKTGINS